jgi:carbon storage regulator CsrA
MNEVVMVGDTVQVVVLSIYGNTVQLGFKAPKSVSIHRSEIYHRIHMPKRVTSEYQQPRFVYGSGKSSCI